MHAGDKTALAQQVNPLLPEVDVPQLGAATCVSLPRERNCGLVVDLNHSRLREFETRLLNCVAEREDLIRKECEGIYFSLRTRRSNVLLLELWVCRYRRQLRDKPSGQRIKREANRCDLGAPYRWNPTAGCKERRRGEIRGQYRLLSDRGRSEDRYAG